MLLEHYTKPIQGLPFASFHTLIIDFPVYLTKDPTIDIPRVKHNWVSFSAN